MLNATLGGIDLRESTLRLDEKFGKVVDQPVPDWFAHKLRDFAVKRGAVRPGDAVFRKRQVGKRSGGPIGDRRFDGLFQRLQQAFDWADYEQVSAHTLRHHAIATVERASSKAVALRFARHEPEDANDRYSKATDKEKDLLRLFTSLPPATVREEVTAGLRSLDGARVRAFIPVLVAKRAKDRLRTLQPATTARPSSHGQPPQH